jgi:predicted signal transduction protein with EAL and GGDEF domain
MYEAKAAGRDTARFFSPETDQRVLARQHMEAQLREAYGADVGGDALHVKRFFRTADSRIVR